MTALKEVDSLTTYLLMEGSGAMRRKLLQFEHYLAQESLAHPVDCPLQHTFAPGAYARTIYIPAGSAIVGKIHKHAHLNMLMQGTVFLITEDGPQELTGPLVMVSKAGTKRALYAKTDLVWTTVHLTDSQDLAEIEDQVIAKTYEELDAMTWIAAGAAVAAVGSAAAAGATAVAAGAAAAGSAVAAGAAAVGGAAAAAGSAIGAGAAAAGSAIGAGVSAAGSALGAGAAAVGETISGAAGGAAGASGLTTAGSAGGAVAGVTGAGGAASIAPATTVATSGLTTAGSGGAVSGVSGAGVSGAGAGAGASGIPSTSSLGAGTSGIAPTSPTLSAEAMTQPTLDSGAFQSAGARQAPWVDQSSLDIAGDSNLQLNASGTTPSEGATQSLAKEPSVWDRITSAQEKMNQSQQSQKKQSTQEEQPVPVSSPAPLRPLGFGPSVTPSIMTKPTVGLRR